MHQNKVKPLDALLAIFCIDLCLIIILGIFVISLFCICSCKNIVISDKIKKSNFQTLNTQENKTQTKIDDAENPKNDIWAMTVFDRADKPTDIISFQKEKSESYLIIVVGNTGCVYTIQQIENLLDSIEKLNELNIFICIILFDKACKYDELCEKYKEIEFAILQDKSGEIYNFCVKIKSPWVGIAFKQKILQTCDGFISTKVLIENIKTKDFSKPLTGSG